jgi:hypothetical protein
MVMVRSENEICFNCGVRGCVYRGIVGASSKIDRTRKDPNKALVVIPFFRGRTRSLLCRQVAVLNKHVQWSIKGEFRGAYCYACFAQHREDGYSRKRDAVLIYSLPKRCAK